VKKTEIFDLFGKQNLQKEMRAQGGGLKFNPTNPIYIMKKSLDILLNQKVC